MFKSKASSDRVVAKITSHCSQCSCETFEASAAQSEICKSCSHDHVSDPI